MVAQSEALRFKPGVFDLIRRDRALALAGREPGRNRGRLALTASNYPMSRLFDLCAVVHQRSWRRLKDDPTHIPPLFACRLERLLRPSASPGRSSSYDHSR